MMNDEGKSYPVYIIILDRKQWNFAASALDDPVILTITSNLEIFVFL